MRGSAGAGLATPHLPRVVPYAEGRPARRPLEWWHREQGVVQWPAARQLLHEGGGGACLKPALLIEQGEGTHTWGRRGGKGSV
eukprot:scaffold21413_cov51-Isochrysis_galbana.AAC.1